MQLFFAPDCAADFYSFNKEESNHIIKVLRKNVGDFLYLTDGTGKLYKCSIVDNHPKNCSVKILEVVENFGKRTYYLHVAIAPTKNISRFEWFLEKATEIGIDEITPLLCEHSERTVVKTERLNKVIVSAMKQSLKAYHPKLNEAVKFNDFISSDIPGEKYIAFKDEQYNSHLASLYSKGKSATILIGPEGDFSDPEVKSAISHDFQPVSLGQYRLRTETAGIAASHTIALLNEV